ncbi:MAG TPA: GIY-YIG nuclease family protein [Pyrinomonadaceae bacterium]|nr:GIY-YIG nuclease family protein [Pyrinomonadaceae bacterium]
MFDHIPDVAGIYAIVNSTNGHRYVGQAKKMNTRLRSHVRDLDRGSHRTSEDRRLQNAWNEFGRSVFEVVVLEIVTDNSTATNYHVRPDNLSLAEHFYINERSEYNVDKRIVRDEFKALIEAKAWREP